MVRTNFLHSKTASSYQFTVGTGNVAVANDLDVNGHTNLDNVSIVGVTTATGNVNISGDLAINSTGPIIKLNDTNNNPDYDILNTERTSATTLKMVRFRIMECWSS